MNKGYIYILVLSLYIVFSSFIIKIEEQKQVCSSIKLSFMNQPSSELVSKSSLLNMFKKNKITLINEDWSNIKINAIEKIIEKHPAIKKSACIRKPNNELEIKISQYTPIIRILTNNENYYVSSECTIIPNKDARPALVLVATGNITQNFATHELYNIAQYIYNNNFLNAQIEQIYVDDKGELHLTPRIGQQEILFGKPENYKRKFSMLKALYEQGFTKTGWNKYKTINLKFENQVVCTRAE